MSFNRKKQPLSGPMEQETVELEASREARENEASDDAATLEGFGGLKIAFTGPSDNPDDLRFCQLNNREPLDLATLASLASTSRGMNALFQPILNHRMLVALAQAVVYGEEDRVIELLHAKPQLVEQKTTVTDYSGRKVDHATPFQMALRAGDEVMAEKIKAIYLEANPENGQAVLDAQFNDVFPNGYATHLKEQKESANQFEREYLNPLVTAFDRATPAELLRALDNPDDGHDNSTLRQELNRFRAAFHALSLQEKVYNPNHLLKVFEKYNAKFDGWYGNNNPHRWLRLDLFWRQVIGWEQRYMTTNYAQSFCTGLSNMVDNNQPLQRTLQLTTRDTHFFPLDTASSSKLGSDFGVYSSRWRTDAARRSPVVSEEDIPYEMLAALQNLCRAKTTRLGESCSQNRAAGIRPGV